MVGLNLFMSEQVIQRQAAPNRRKTFYYAKKLYCSKFGNQMYACSPIAPLFFNFVPSFLM